MARREGIEPVVEGADPGAPDLAAIKAELDAIKAERAAEVAKVAEEKRKADEAAAIARGEAETLYKSEKAKAETLEAELATFRKAEKARLAKIDASNADRVKALPDAAKALIPEGMSGEALAAHLDKVAKFVQVEGGGSEPPRARPGAKAAGEIHPDIIAHATRLKVAPAELVASVKKYPTAYPQLASLVGES